MPCDPVVEVEVIAPEVKELTIADILYGAADKVEHKWLQGVAYDGNGGYCAQGAMLATIEPFQCPVILGLSQRHKHSEIINRACRLTAMISNDWSRSLMGWNDQPGRTQQEVVDVLRRAGDLAVQKGL